MSKSKYFLVVGGTNLIDLDDMVTITDRDTSNFIATTPDFLFKSLEFYGSQVANEGEPLEIPSKHNLFNNNTDNA